MRWNLNKNGGLSLYKMRICHECNINKIGIFPWFFGIRICEPCDPLNKILKLKQEEVKEMQKSLEKQQRDFDEQKLYLNKLKEDSFHK